jgi:hypothetical protein
MKIGQPSDEYRTTESRSNVFGMRTIGDLEQHIRKLVTARGRERFTRRDWHSVCAALDNLGDTALALQSYQRASFGRTLATQYLRVFGFLQALYLQEDSIIVLQRKLLGVWPTVSRASAWSRIRELRNRVGGHPAERAGFLARISIRRQHFKIMYWNKRKATPEFEDVDLRALFTDYKCEARRCSENSARSCCYAGGSLTQRLQATAGTCSNDRPSFSWGPVPVRRRTRAVACR